jgi:hypothetical protein
VTAGNHVRRDLPDRQDLGHLGALGAATYEFKSPPRTSRRGRHPLGAGHCGAAAAAAERSDGHRRRRSVTLRWTASPTPDVLCNVYQRDASAGSWQKLPLPLSGITVMAGYLANGTRTSSGHCIQRLRRQPGLHRRLPARRCAPGGTHRLDGPAGTAGDAALTSTSRTSGTGSSCAPMVATGSGCRTRTRVAARSRSPTWPTARRTTSGCSRPT